MKKVLFLSLAIILTAIFVESSYAESGGQVFFRYGLSSLKNDRGTQVFTDTNGAAGKNDDKSGWNISAGLDTALIRKLGPGDIIGEIMLDYSKFSQKQVRQTTSALLGGTNNTEVTVSEFIAVVAPKYRLDGIAGGKLRPWIIPVGLAFMVNSPPSNDTTYLDIGYHAGIGVEYMVMDALSIGVDYRVTIASGEPNFKATYSNASLYVGINF
ncbi:MAG: outer membrane beta-barrel protein [Deltaproteobacteria bacterium]|nr:outer membrane beta-barrel protein [Deltaproteobacteria bacterium]